MRPRVFPHAGPLLLDPPPHLHHPKPSQTGPREPERIPVLNPRPFSHTNLSGSSLESKTPTRPALGVPPGARRERGANRPQIDDSRFFVGAFVSAPSVSRLPPEFPQDGACSHPAGHTWPQLVGRAPRGRLGCARGTAGGRVEAPVRTARKLTTWPTGLCEKNPPLHLLLSRPKTLHLPFPLSDQA